MSRSALKPSTPLVFLALGFTSYLPTVTLSVFSFSRLQECSACSWALHPSIMGQRNGFHAHFTDKEVEAEGVVSLGMQQVPGQVSFSRIHIKLA